MKRCRCIKAICVRPAFYLFKLPAVWHRFLAFNIVVDGDAIHGDPGTKYALACGVIPMGWLNSVGIMQEISEKLLSTGALRAEHRIAKGCSLPPWMSAVLDHAKESDKNWWHVYLDNYAGGERILPSEAGTSAKLCHEAAEIAWKNAGVISSEKKRLSSERRVTELGAEVDGTTDTLGLGTEKLLKLIQATLWMLSQGRLDRKTVQVMAGRWVFALQFRRPAMSYLQHTWSFISGKQKLGERLRVLVKGEFLSLAFVAPLLHCNLGAQIAPQIICTDASEMGGSVEVAEAVTATGMDFLQACEKLERSPGKGHSPIILLSLFNGIGGSFRCYDLIGVVPLVRIAVDIDDAANRVTSRRWPGTVMVKDIRTISRQVVQDWSLKYLDVTEIHVWGGWPCVDLSRVKAGRLNLEGPQSSLFWEIPRVLKTLREVFGSQVIIRYVFENVASMDESAAEQISEEIGSVPYRFDCADAGYCWTSETVEGCLPDVFVENKRYWKDVVAEAVYPPTKDWITPGYQWEGEEVGAIFPTCLKSIPRSSPPPKPAGLNKTDHATRKRWSDDSYRYPPYQYDWKFLLTTNKTWRLLNATEKELLLGYGLGHTALCWSASKSKQNQVGFSDCRHKLLGDSFSCYSFVIMAVACCRGFLPQLTYEHLVNRMGLAPGFCAHIRSRAPLSRMLAYGSGDRGTTNLEGGINSLNRMMLRKTNHTGSDICILSGEICSSKAFPRQSVESCWWTWKRGFTTTWKGKSHINVLELETVLLGIKFQVQRYGATDMRIFQLCDSYVCMSVVSKGRSSSKQLTRVLNQISAYLLAHGLQLVMAHVDSLDNPSEAGSRAS